MDGSVMEPPANVHRTCAWAGGAPLAGNGGTGVSVIAGHVNYVGQGPGAFARIDDLTAGQTITTSGPGDDATTWSVTGVVAYRKSGGLPANVFTRPAAGHRTLRLITCGGRLQSDGNYADNVVVTAVAQ